MARCPKCGKLRLLFELVQTQCWQSRCTRVCCVSACLCESLAMAKGDDADQPTSSGR